ncbi:hypothetical protein [Streptomyces anulatus]|uniref:hypothetical protein n=1 Tax=Streptomyces anulatus TaxID=1892 RepID=UPI002F917B39
MNTDRLILAAASLENPLLRKVSRRLDAAGYQPGHALPAGLIALHFQVTPQAVQQALAALARAGKVEFRPNGEYGPGYYMPAPHRPNSLARHGARARSAA